MYLTLLWVSFFRLTSLNSSRNSYLNRHDTSLSKHLLSKVLFNDFCHLADYIYLFSTQYIFQAVLWELETHRWWTWGVETTPMRNKETQMTRMVSGCQFYATIDSDFMPCIAMWKFYSVSYLRITYHRKGRKIWRGKESNVHVRTERSSTCGGRGHSFLLSP